MKNSGPILILGSRGSLGTELKGIYPAEKVVAIGREELDITNKEQVRRIIAELRPSIVFNCAAYTAVDLVETDYDRALLLNGAAPGYIAQACAEAGAIMIHFSTGMVFKGDSEIGYNEDAPTDPVNAYGRTKLAGEQALAKSTSSYYLIRTEWLYSSPLLSTSGASKKSFNEIMLELAVKNSTLKGVDDEFGRPTWTRDLAFATKELIESSRPFGTYHITNSGKASRLDWAREIFKIKNMNIAVEPVPGAAFPRPAARPRYELLNNTKLTALRPWQEALQEYLTSI